MDEKIQKLLSKKEIDPWHASLLSHVKMLVEKSARDMSQYYERWDRNRLTYRSRRELDEKDRRAAEKAEPVKMTLPLTYAQVETFVAYGVDMLLQRDQLFELRGTNQRGHETARVAEAILERDIRKSKPRTLLSQVLRDVSLCDLGVTKTAWVEHKEMQSVKIDMPAESAFGVEIQQQHSIYERRPVTTFQGNELTVVSPYHFFPDTRLPLSRFQEGEFCADEHFETYMSLKRLEAQGLVAGIDHVSSFKQDDWERRSSNRFDITSDSFDEPATRKTNGEKPTFVRTCVQVDIIPAKFIVDDATGETLGESKQPERWLIEYANDSRIIRAEPYYYPHGRFSYAIAQFTVDQHELLSESLADLVHYLQDVATYLINSHVTSQRKVIDNKLVGIPSALHMEDFSKNRPFVRVKKGYEGMPLDKLVHQLQVQDVTQNNIQEVNGIIGLIQQVTGMSPNLGGSFASGRRSAREVNAVNSSGLTRIRLVLGTFYEQFCIELGEQMIMNSREGLTEETYVKLVGDGAYELQSMNGYLNVTRDAIDGIYEFEQLDGTSPSERSDRAVALGELFMQMLGSDPVILQQLDYSLDALLREILLLRGVRHPERFKNSELLKRGDPSAQQQPMLAPPTEDGGDPMAQLGAMLGA